MISILDFRYANTAKRVSLHFRDQPMTPRESTVYWSEYVIRHRGAFHLRSSAMDLNFIQYHNVDILLILLVAIVMVLYLSERLITYMWQRFVWRRTSLVTKSKKDF